MPTQPSTIDPTKYRSVEYVGGRILQDRELKLMQQLEGDLPAQGKYTLGAMFLIGATLNMSVSVVGAVVTLSPTNPSAPMLVYLRNNWEVFTAAPITVTPGVAGTLSYVYLNFVLWRVTSEGEDGTLEDGGLIDAATHEATAEMGQLQIYVGADDHGAVNTTLMFDRNTIAYPMVTLLSNGLGHVTPQAITSVNPQITGSNTRPGMVMLTTPTSSIAAATDDPRLSDARTPLDASVNTAKVQLPNATGAQVVVTNVDQRGATQVSLLTGVATGDTNGGINSKRVFYDGWSTTVNDVITLLWGKIVGIYGVLFGHENRITTLETTVAPNYAYHIGHKLGENTPGIAQSHPPVVDNAGDPYNTFPGFQVIGTPASNPSGQGAFNVLTSGGAANGMLDHSGNYQYLNPTYSPLLIAAPDSLDFRAYFGFAYAALNFMRNGGTFTFAGDVGGPGPRNTTVTGLWNRPVAGFAPNVGDVLTWNGTSWAPQAPAANGGITNMRVEAGYFIHRINIVGGGSMEMAFGSGTINSGSPIPLPSGFSYDGMFRLISPGSVHSNSPNNNDSLSYQRMDTNAGTASVYSQGTAGVQWPRGASPNTETVQWIAVVWRSF